MDAIKRHNEFITKIFSEPEYYDVVRNSIFRNIPEGNSIDIDDCISDVYAFAVEKCDLEEHPHIHGWLSKVAKNMAKRHVRRKYSGDTVSFDDVHEWELADLLTPAKIVEDMTLQQDFIELLKEQLTPEEFLIYEMKYVKKFSNAEIAAKMRIDVNAANVRLSRLKNKVTKIFNEM